MLTLLVYSVHEYNTQPLVLTFMPYYTAPIFGTLLSILPQNILPAFRFLQPYIQSNACPPRHTIVYAASTNGTFLLSLSTYVLGSCRLGLHYPVLLSFWASITAEAVVQRCGQSRSGSLKAQKQSQEDIMLLLLPKINETFTISNIPELRVATYMILTVLASRIHLKDGALTGLMEAVVSGWTDTSRAGLTCLAFFAEKMHDVKLSKKVIKALLALEGLENDIVTLSKQYAVGKLVLGLIRGIILRLQWSPVMREVRVLSGLFKAQVMSRSSSALAIQCLFDATMDMAAAPDTQSESQESLTNLLLLLAETPNVGNHMEAILQAPGAGRGFVKAHLQKTSQGPGSPIGKPSAEEAVGDVHEDSTPEIFATLTSKLPTRTAYETSFLSHSESYIFGSLEKVFREISGSREFLQIFSKLPVLRRTLAMTEPLFLSFYIRTWCGKSPERVRVAAVHTVSEYVKEEPLTSDLQFLFPYILYALSDPSEQLRKATGDLILNLSSLYSRTDAESTRDAPLVILGKNQIYGANERSRNISWLSLKEFRRLLDQVIVPGLEECLLDCTHASRLLVDILNGSRHGPAAKSRHHELKGSSRLAILNCLCSHAVHTPLYAVKLQLLQTLNKVEKVGSMSRSKLLLPILCATRDMDGAAVANVCGEEGVDISEFLTALIGIVTPIDRDGMQVLNSIIVNPVGQSICGLRDAALSRIKGIWSSIKPDLQFILAESLLQVSLSAEDGDDEHFQEVDALNTLTALPLSSAILSSFLEDLPTLSDDTHDKPGTSKRRRVSHHQLKETNGAPGPDSSSKIRHLTLVLELVEQSLAEQRPWLLKELFRVFTDIQHSQSCVGGGKGYLQILLLDSIFAIVRDIENLPNSKVDLSAIRVDLLIDCIRTTSSPQARNIGLLLISALAHRTPELILHSVMPIFTFMGSNVLSRADDFSTHVINQTMDSIIPRLIQSLHRHKGNPLSAVSELLLSFAAAFEHVPVHRRLDIYTSLIDKIGPDSYLYAFIAILMNKYPKNRRVLQFASDFTGNYSVRTQLKTVGQYLDLLRDMLKAKPTVSTQVLPLDAIQGGEESVINLLHFVPTVINTRSFVSRSRKKLLLDGTDASPVRAQYEQTYERLLLLLHIPMHSKRTQSLCEHALDALLGLLPMAELVGAFEKLLMRAEDSSRRQIMLSFERRMEDSTDILSAQNSCLQLLPRLIATVHETLDPSLKLSAIHCIDKIVEMFGKKDLDVVLRCAQAITNDTCIGAIEAHVRVASLLCLTTTVEAAGDNSVPLMPIAFPSTMEQLEQSMATATKNASLHNAAYSFLSALLLYVPWMMTGPYLDRLLIASHESANSALGDQCDGTRREALGLIGKHIDADACFATLHRTWINAMSEGPIAVKEHMEILRSTIEQWPKSTILQLSETLGDLFLRVFDLRRIQLSPRTNDSYEDAEVEDVEDAFNGSAITMVYKLNDATFRPFFIRAVSWASSSLFEGDIRGKDFRRTTWYNFLLCFFGTLKVDHTSTLNRRMC